ncbi:glycosyltransferase [bacterium]|nr:glycosyltransferase [bacterium]
MILDTLAVSAGALHLTIGSLVAAALLKKGPAQDIELPLVSIVVPARNEAANLPRLFKSLESLRYEYAKLELVLVNDDSTDQTCAVAHELSRKLPFRVRIFNASHGQTESLPPTKTLPLAQGIDEAKGEIILMTDGDCEVPQDWVLDIVRHFEQDVGLVCGITLPDYENTRKLETRFESVDWSLLLGVCAGMCRLGSPLALIGNNYAVRKKCYEDVGTFRGISHNRIDDIALFRAVADSKKWGIAFAVTQGACVVTLPVGSTTDLVNQRYRWMEGFRAISVRGKLLFGFGLATHLLWPILLLFSGKIGGAAGFAVMLGDWLVISSVLTRLNRRGLYMYMYVYPLYALAYGWRLVLSIFRRPAITWKDRRLA